MKKIFLTLLLGLSLIGCASQPKFDPYTAFGSWYPIGTRSGNYILVEPSSKKAVADGVYSIYSKESNSSYMYAYIANCYTREIATGREILKKSDNTIKVTNVNGTFLKVYPDTTGWLIYNYLCR